MVKGAVRGKEGVHGEEGGMRGEVGCAWQQRRPIQRTVRILLECILVLRRDTKGNRMLCAIYT